MGDPVVGKKLARSGLKTAICQSQILVISLYHFGLGLNTPNAPRIELRN
jgi:hypothetical protein